MIARKRQGGWNTMPLFVYSHHMNCGTFRDGHAEYVDGVLKEQDQFAMQQHTVECAACAAHDASVRRALLLFRNMPDIEPSPDFLTRLENRLHAASMGRVDRSWYAHVWQVQPWRVQGILAAAAVLAAVGFGVRHAHHGHVSAPTYAMAPVVITGPDMMPEALAQASPVSPLTSPMMVTSVSTGMPMWSAAMLARQMSERFAASAFKTVSLRH